MSDADEVDAQRKLDPMIDDADDDLVFDGARAMHQLRAFSQISSIVVASTTSTQDSGLFGHILPLFKAKTGIDVKVVSQGTGQTGPASVTGDEYGPMMASTLSSVISFS